MVLHYLILSSCVARRLMPGTTPNARHRGGSMFTVCGSLSQLTLADYVMILFQIILSGLLFLWLASFVFTRSCFHFFLYPPISLDLWLVTVKRPKMAPNRLVCARRSGQVYRSVRDIIPQIVCLKKIHAYAMQLGWVVNCSCSRWFCVCFIWYESKSVTAATFLLIWHICCGSGHLGDMRLCMTWSLIIWHLWVMRCVWPAVRLYGVLKIWKHVSLCDQWFAHLQGGNQRFVYFLFQFFGAFIDNEHATCINCFRYFIMSHMTCKDSNCECWTLSANNFGCFDRFFLILSFDLWCNSCYKRDQL